MISCPLAPASIPHALARPLLFGLDAERAHDLVLGALAHVSRLPRILGRIAAAHEHADAALAVEVLGQRFANPLGIAAGFDKDARAVPALAAFGFGCVEVGTVTPLPQPGNERPRLARLAADAALVNSLGFPSEGAEVVAARLAALRRPCVVGVNVGRNRRTPNEATAADACAVVRLVHAHADYLVVNVSSPNTPDLRALQRAAELGALVEEVVRAASAQAALSGTPPRPVLVKVAPDLELPELEAAVDAAAARGAAGFVIANTTTRRPASLRAPGAAALAGGLSGPMLFERTLDLVRHVFRRLDGRLTIVGVGGVTDGESAWRLIRAGASLVQAYTAFVYVGPSFPRVVLQELSRRLERAGSRSIADVVGADA